MIHIKICGITNKKEIEYLNILKPEYIGFVFTKSKRQVTGEEARELSLNLDKNIKKVGVFRDNSIEDILDVLVKMDLDVIQLHGKEDENFIKGLKKNLNPSIKIWKAISIKDIEDINKYCIGDKQKADSKEQGDYLIESFLIDGDTPGSGETYSLENINKYFEEKYSFRDDDLNLKKFDFYLAGGITDENVVERIAEANANGVDVSSGVEVINENGKRIKSFEKMKNLIEKVRGLEV